MTKRRATFLGVLVMLATVVCLPLSLSAAPPQFNPQWQIVSRSFSPFPAFDPPFISSITPQEVVPLVKTTTAQPYSLTYDYPKSSISYRRRIKNEIYMVPVNSAFDVFVNRRIALSMQQLAYTTRKESLVKEQKNKAGGLFQFTIPIPSRAFESIFGEGGAGLKVSGYRRISFTGRSNWSDKPQTVFNRQSKFPALQMEQEYRFDIEGTIGSKISVKVSQDSRNDIPLANRLILRYKGAEDDVLQSVEAGNTTLDLPSTQFLAYSTRVQGLFGIKASAQLADLSVTAIASQEKGSTETVQLSSSTSSTATSVIRDIDYQERRVYDLGRLPLKRARSDNKPEPAKYDFQPGNPADSTQPGDYIQKLIVYRDDNTSDQARRLVRPIGICYIDPQDTTSDDPQQLYRTTGYFEVIDAADVYLSPENYYMLFLRPVIGSNDVVAVYMEVLRRRNGVTYVDTIGDISRDTLRLKLIKPQAYNEVNHHIWEYEWRNVYYLGRTNIDIRNFDVAIYKGAPINNERVNPDDLDHNQDGKKYIEILGLDRGDDNSTGAPDGEIDREKYLDRELGLLYFPNRHPFDQDTFYVTNTAGQPVYLLDSVPEIYLSSNPSVITQSSHYYIAVTSQERGSAIIQLNATNIIEGSEVVKNGDDLLVRDRDYTIDYDFGRLTLLREDLSDITSNLSIMFERAPFFSLERKTLLGTRLEYNPSRDLNVGTTLLYKSDKSTNRKPKIGEETSNMLVWDADLSYNFKLPIMTSLVNAIPFLSASAESFVQMSAEVAQSRPNPNVDGEVYIDDFEGAKDSYSLGIQRTVWRHASRPALIDTAVSEQGHVAWFNPETQVSAAEVWNRKDENIGTGETGLVTTLKIQFRPVDHKFVRDTINKIIDSVSVPIEPERSWDGFMRNISQGAALQIENAQLLEMRVNGNRGIMHVDLGRINEDINGDAKLQNEDLDGLRILDEGEDVGLDGLPDNLEFGYNPANGVFDPAGDNFDSTFTNIWRINGTEGNASDPDGGYLPDTEDPNYNGLDRLDDYFSYRIDLGDDSSENSFVVPGTKNDYGWKTIRVPLREAGVVDTVIGQPEWNNILFARIWFDSASSQDIINPVVINIASLELLSTTWADSFYVADSLFSGGANFNVAVINDEVDGNYQPPVAGYYDPSLDKTETEQSLLLTFENLNAQVDVSAPDSGVILAADTGLAVRRFYRANNLMGYGKLQAYVWGGVHDSTGRHSDSVMFFFRLGYDKDAYYEYRTILKPGWDPENHVLIDFNEITGLKARLLADYTKGVDSATLRVEGKYAVKIKPPGQDPTLTRIQYFAMGVVNLDPDKVAAGEVWVDELRLTDVKNDVGMAGKLAVNGNLSDLGNYSFSYSTQDAYYRGVSAATKGGAADNLGSGQTRTNYNFSGSVRLDKFFPRSLELQLPLRVSWTQNVQKPLLRSGTDITLPEEFKKQETEVTVNRSIQISQKFNKNTKNPLYTLFLNRLSTSFSYNTTKGHSAAQPMFMSERYNAKGSFDMSVRKPPSIALLAWMAYLKAPFGLPKTRLYLYPTRVDFNANLDGSYSNSVNQNSTNPTSSKLDFRGGMNTNFNIFDNLKGSFSFNTDRDLRDPKKVNVTLNPKKFRLGVERNYNQQFNLNYTPVIFSFLTHRFDYSARYNDTYRNVGRDTAFVHGAESSVNIDVSFSFKHQSIIGSNKSGRSTDRGRPGGKDDKSGKDGKGDKGGKGGKDDKGGQDGKSDQARPQRERSGGSAFGVLGLPLKGIRYITDAIKPVSGKFGTGQTQSFALADKASFAYRFGLTENPGAQQVATTGGNIRENKSIAKSFSANSGLSLFAGIGVDAAYSRNTRESYVNQATKTTAESWPDLSLDLRSVKGLWYVGKVLNALAPSVKYTKSTETNRRLSSPDPYEVRTREAFAPLISFTLNPLRSMRTTFRADMSKSQTIQYNENTGQIQNVTRQTTQGLSVGWSFSFRSPTGVKLPILGRIKFESNLSVSTEVSLHRNRDESAKSDMKFEVSSDKTNFAVVPTASYSFSSTVKGGVRGRWQDDFDKRQRETRHTRELGFWVELRF